MIFTSSFLLNKENVAILKTKGYKITSDSKDADIVFRTNIRYSGLAKDANTGTGALSGAAAGGLGGMGAVQGMGADRITRQGLLPGWLLVP